MTGDGGAPVHAPDGEQIAGGRPCPARRPWLPALFALAVVGVYGWLVTYGTGSLAGEETWGSAYDSLAHSLEAGRADVEPETISWEGFEENGKTFLSFGLFPALLRIVPDAVVPSMFGRWSRASCLLAAVLAALAAALSFAAALRGPGRAPPRAGRLLWWAGALGFALGSPLLYLVSCARIYHEAILWGLCGSLWGIYFVLRIVTDSIDRARGFLGLSLAFGVALLARVTFGIPLAVAIAVLSVRELVAARRRPAGERGLARVLLACAPAVGAGLLQLWYNHARFGSIWKSFDFQATYVHPAEIGGVVNLARVPSALVNYFGLTAASLFSRPPFVQLAPVRYLDDSIFFGWKEQVLSLTLGSSWLVLGAVLGAVALARRRRLWELLVALAFLPEVAVIATFYFVTERYAADLLPLLVVLFAVFLLETARRGRPAPRLGGLLLGLAACSAVVTIAGTLDWNLADNGDAPAEYKERLGRLLQLEGHAPGCPGPCRPLTAEAPLAESHTFAPPRFNRTWDDHIIAFDHRIYANGIGMHADSRISYRVPDGAVALCAVAGLPDSSLSCRAGSVVFQVRDGSDHLLAATGVIRTGDAAVPLRVNLRGVREVTLVVLDGGDGIDCDHGTWGDPVFLLGPAPAAAPAAVPPPPGR